MDISLLNKSVDAVELGGLTFHYLRPQHTAMVQLDYEASAYLQADAEYSLRRVEVLEKLKEERGITGEVKELDEDEIRALDREFSRRLTREGVKLEVPAEEVIPIIRFVVAHLEDVEGLTNAGEPQGWNDLEEAVRVQIIDALDPTHLYTLYSTVKESVSLPLGVRRDSGNTLRPSTPARPASAPSATPTGTEETASTEEHLTT